MQRVAESLTTMGAEQLLLTLVLLASYALALGEFVSFRVRLGAVGIAVLATAGFAALSPSWEAGVILMTLVPVGMGLFAAAAWMLWSLAMWREHRALAAEAFPAEQAPRRRMSTTPLLRLIARLRFI